MAYECIHNTVDSIYIYIFICMYIYLCVCVCMYIRIVIFYSRIFGGKNLAYMWFI